ncbi:MAG TPA: hypothetical protein VK851_15380 [Anaerolineales bacterium]|nr:hypothetical protein [Anaerolineales bacterium]
MNKNYLMVIIILVFVTLVACGQIGQSPAETNNQATQSNDSTETLQEYTERVVGLIPIDRFPDLVVIDVPLEVQVNKPFTVSVTTYGSSSCTTVDGADVKITDNVAEITPYDRQPIGNDVECTADLALHPRDIIVTLSVPGRATIRVIGQNFDGERITQEHIITVVP